MKKLLYALSSGLLLALSWPTYGFPFLLFIAFVPLLLLEHEITVEKKKYSDVKIFGFSYVSFLIWNYGATQWLHFAQNPDGSNSWIAFLFPLFVNSLLMSLVFTLFHFVKRKAGTWYGIFFFPIIWICFEKFHLTWELSWPWLNLGNAFADYPQVIQWYDSTGTLGGTLWVLVVNMVIFYNLRAYQVSKKKIYLWKMIYFPILLIGVPIAISLLKYQTYEEQSEQNLEVVLAQPDLDPYNEKYQKDGVTITRDLLSSVEKEVTPKTAFIVAPETAFPGNNFVFVNDFDNDLYLHFIKDWMLHRAPQANLVSGVSLAQFYDVEKTPTARYVQERNQWVDLFNSAIQINPLIPAHYYPYYHKSKLVVGVEHFPYTSLLKPLLGDYLLNFGGSTNSLGIQKERAVFSNLQNKARVAPVICYESIYGEYVGEYVKRGANVLFIMTNDSWWHNSQGHKQLLAYARLRAIETRRDIARSANSGISAFINQRGDIIKSMPYLEKGGLKGSVNLNSELTFYVKYGDLISRVAFILAGIILAYTLTKSLIPLLKGKKKRIKK